jgi:DNA-binding MarR family transcriptional regulator
MSRKPARRPELIAALNTALRDTSGLGVLHSQAMAERAGISSSDLECLDVIVLRGPLTAGALAEATGLTTGAITGVVDRLERAGYARREHDRADRRKVLVRATKAVDERIMPLSLPMQRAALTALEAYSDAELALLLDFLTRAHAASLAAMAELRAMKLPAKKSKARGRARK